ncbi:hypothetical protein [Microbacterium gilvum]|uniref:Uncharacterized protein n=1 Tax=Microbacterium gilvum TaxID=1336204 RepID=A0ABP8ZPE4_9MICO
MSTLLDADTVVLEGLEFEVPCGRSCPDHPHAATHSCTCRSCGDLVLLCATCIAALNERLASDALFVLVCFACHRMTTRCVEDLAIVVPL